MASLWNLCACMTKSVMCMWPRSRAWSRVTVSSTKDSSTISSFARKMSGQVSLSNRAPLVSPVKATSGIWRAAKNQVRFLVVTVPSVLTIEFASRDDWDAFRRLGTGNQSRGE